jgi:hypothetical protein
LLRLRDGQARLLSHARGMPYGKRGQRNTKRQLRKRSPDHCPSPFLFKPSKNMRVDRVYIVSATHLYFAETCCCSATSFCTGIEPGEQPQT